MRRRRVPAPTINRSAFAVYRFPPDVIILAVRWYLRYGLLYRDVEELLAERGVVVDHVSVYRWVQTFTPLLIHAARCRRHRSGDRWFVDETYVRVAGRPPGHRRYCNNRVEADHARLKARLRPMRGLKRPGSAMVLAGGHAFVQKIRRGHYELAIDSDHRSRVAHASTSSWSRSERAG